MQPALQQEVTLLLMSMPASWAAHVCGLSPQPTHMAPAALGDSRVSSPSFWGEGGKPTNLQQQQQTYKGTL